MTSVVIAYRRLRPVDWTFLEAKIEAAFRGLKRKNGDDMYHHSIDVGRRLLADKQADDICIFAGYCHDLLEDTEVTKDYLYDIAKSTFDNHRSYLRDATQCVNLVEAVSYTEFEYSLDKPLRKQAASKRWLEHDDFRVRLIKKADIESNMKDAASVSPTFEAEYLSWAKPLHENIIKSFQ